MFNHNKKKIFITGCVLCGLILGSSVNSFAEKVIDPIDKSGIYTLEDGTIIQQGDFGIDAYKSDITVNVGETDSGTLKIQLNNGFGIDAYGNYLSTQDGSTIKINGNLEISIDGTNISTTVDNHGISVMYGASQIDLNGDANVNVNGKTTNQFNSYVYGLIAQGNGTKINANGAMNISVSSWGKGKLVEAVGANAYDGGSIYFNEDVNIHDITAYAEKSPNNEVLVYAAGAVANGDESLIEFNKDTIIKSVNGECEDPNNHNVTEVAIAAESGGEVRVNFEKDNTVQIEGDVVAYGEGSKISLNLNNIDSYLEAEVLSLEGGVVDLSLSNSAIWKVRGNEIDSITSNDGIISMFYNRNLDDTLDEDYDNLTVNVLKGSSTTFVLNSDLKNDRGDQFTVGSIDEENHSYVQFYDTQYISPQEGHEYIFAYIPGENMEISGKQTDIGIYKYDPVLREELVNDVKHIYLTGFEKSGGGEESGSAIAIENTALATIGLWRSHDSNLWKRMGAIDSDIDNKVDVWLRANAGRQELNSSIEQNLITVQGGADVRSEKDTYSWYIGGAANYNVGNVELDLGEIKTNAIGLQLYSTWMYDNGHYLDLVVNGAKMSSQFQTYINTDQETKTEYGNWGTGISAEYGYKGPLNENGYYSGYQTQVIAGYVTGAEYITDTNIDVKIEPIKNLTLKALGIFGREMNMENGSVNIYGKLGVGHEFIEKNVVNMKDANQEIKEIEQDLRGTWMEYGVGIKGKIGEHTNCYLEFDKTSFGKINTVWRANVGVRLIW